MGCAHHRHHAKSHHPRHLPPPKPDLNSPCKYIKQYRQIKPFSRVHLVGRMSVQVHTGYRNPSILLTGDGRDLEQVKVFVHHHTLYVVLGKGFPRFSKISVDLRTRSLNGLYFVGSGVVRGTQLNSRALDVHVVNNRSTVLGGRIGLRSLDVGGKGVVQISGIYGYLGRVRIKDQAKVQLIGTSNIAEILMQGRSWLSMHWVKSYHLRIKAKDKPKIQLAGSVTRLEVELYGGANFKGRYLRADRSFVRTHDHAIAEISSANHQSTLATDASDVFYYNLPTTRADFMAYNGAVLDMREWDQPELKDFNRYNHQFP
jgi:hypothetical protein